MLKNRHKKSGHLIGNRLVFSDSDRIQTCNRLIRSQVLYSVELRSHFLIASANVGQKFFLCKFLSHYFLKKITFFINTLLINIL